MRGLLRLSGLIDAMNQGIGKLAYWLVLVAVVVSAVNAVVRYGLNTSSNAWLELQWYLFSAVFLLEGMAPMPVADLRAAAGELAELLEKFSPGARIDVREPAS